jgi:hypothetical protein
MAVRPDSESIQRLLQKSGSLWSSYATAATDARLPAECNQIQNVLSRVPAFPTRLLQSNQTTSTLRYLHSAFGLQISGRSSWHTSHGECELPPKILHCDILCGVRSSTGCVLVEHCRFADWPGIQNEDEEERRGNHLAILILAWSYILSARWIELQGNGHGMHYADMQAAWLKKEEEQGEEDVSQGIIEVDIGEASLGAARWWAAILAAGDGWRAELTVGDQLYRSPWSAHIASSRKLKLRTIHTHAPNESQLPPSSDEALDYLREYCESHGIGSQCIPALAASLFLPWKNGEKDSPVSLPVPKIFQAPTVSERKPSSSSSSPLQNTLRTQYQLLPYYMTLSCNVWGLRALLCGTFYEPAVPCILVSPWLQPVFEMIDPIIAREDFGRFVTIMSKRQPRLAALWLGAVMLGIEKTVLLYTRAGPPVELHVAAWTGTIHSFINFTSHSRCVKGNEISRAGECRLLFLTGCENHLRVPIFPWQPFGSTPLELTEIEVQQHATCRGHELQYEGWCWDTADGLSSGDCGFGRNIAMDATATEIDIASVSASTHLRALESENLSKSATRGIFGWLRADGYPPNEKDIFTHDWFDVGSSSEEGSVASENSSPEDSKCIVAWLDTVGKVE